MALCLIKCHMTVDWPVGGASAQVDRLVLRTIDGEDVEESGKNMF